MGGGDGPRAWGSLRSHISKPRETGARAPSGARGGPIATDQRRHFRRDRFETAWLALRIARFWTRPRRPPKPFRKTAPRNGPRAAPREQGAEIFKKRNSHQTPEFVREPGRSTCLVRGLRTAVFTRIQGPPLRSHPPVKHMYTSQGEYLRRSIDLDLSVPSSFCSLSASQ